MDSSVGRLQTDTTFFKFQLPSIVLSVSMVVFVIGIDATNFCPYNSLQTRRQECKANCLAGTL